jgi:tetratricopeptide (TPR) repeat protein
MGKITSNFLQMVRRFRQWDAPSQIAFALAVLLALVGLTVVSVGPEDLNIPATIGALGSMFAAQGVFMWANRDMVTDYTRAQRLYRAGQFDDARDALEGLYAGGKANINVLTLLGNTYRQLGKLAESERILLEALDIQPNHYFPLYGFGRTLLVQGRYAEAADAIQRALAQGAPEVTRFDLGEAQYRQEQHATAIETLTAAHPLVADEPHRQLMATYMLHTLGESDPPTLSLIDAGLPYWQAEAQRHANTRYGIALSEAVDQLIALKRKD